MATNDSNEALDPGSSSGCRQEPDAKRAARSLRRPHFRIKHLLRGGVAGPAEEAGELLLADGLRRVLVRLLECRLIPLRVRLGGFELLDADIAELHLHRRTGVELEREDDGSVVEGEIPRESHRRLGLREGEALVVRPRRLQVFLEGEHAI